MTKFPKMAAAALLGLSIAACSGNDAPDADNVTETQMDDVDVIDGTISDDMVDVDTIQKVDATGEDEKTEAGAKKDSGSGDEQEAVDAPAE